MSPSATTATKGNGISKSSNTSEINVAVHTEQKPAFNSHGSKTHKLPALRDATQRAVGIYRARLGSASERFLTSCQTVETFFDVLAGIRLRQMPHSSSRWDKVLKWAEFFALQVQGCSEEASLFEDYAEKASCIIWASMLSMLQLGPKYISVLEKAFGVFYSCGFTLGLFLRHHELLHASEELQHILITSFADLLILVTGVNIDLTQKNIFANFTESVFDERFGPTIESFVGHGDRFTNTIWEIRLQSLAKPGDMSVDIIREFLLPNDTITRTIAVSGFIRKPRADFTCEWFSQHLTDFTRSENGVLLVTGKPATGKTVLFEWVVEKLQSLNGRRGSEVIAYTIDPDLRTETTSLSIVKGLLLQMLRLSVGDNGLYKSLVSAYEISLQGSPTAQIENVLWQAIEGGLRTDRNQTIVLDGLNHLNGGESEKLKLLEHLNSIALKHSKTKCVVFSRPLYSPAPASYAKFSIEPQHTNQDMFYVAESSLPPTANFEGLGEKGRAKLSSNLVKGANGSFGWLIYALELLKTYDTPENTLKAAEGLPKELSGLIELFLQSLDLKHRDTKSIMAWILAAERPLLVREINQLIEVDTSTCTRVPRSSRIEDDISHALGPLVDIRNGFVRFRHAVIKENILARALAVTDFKNSGPFPFSIMEAQYDLAIRCMAYIKIHFTRQSKPMQEPLSNYELDELFKSYVLLQYSARYWVSHFETSPMYESGTKHKITANFKACFPDSTLFAIVEGSCFKLQYQSAVTLNHLLTVLSVRRTILGESSQPVLQTLLNITCSKQLTNSEATTFYYEAWKQSVSLHITSIATACAYKYVDLTSTLTISKKSEISSRRIELLQYIIAIQRQTGVSDREIMVHLELLATVYITIGNTEKATEYYQEIYKLSIRIYGRNAPETRQFYEKLTTVVQKSTKSEEIYEIVKKDYDEALYTLPATDARRITLSWSMVEFYEKQNNTRKLEETLVMLWQSLTRLTHNKDTKAKQTKIDVALRYVELLKRQKRNREAENILRTLWIDLEQDDTELTTTVTQTTAVGEQLQSVGAMDAARSVFARLWAYYVKTGKQSTAEASSISTALTQVTRETTSETTYEVTTLVEIFETTIITATTETLTTTSINNAVALVVQFYEQKNWKEVIRIGTITLEKIWPSFNSQDIRSPLPTTYYSETIDLIDRLAFAYLKIRRFDSVESIYRRVFYAVIGTPNSPDTMLTSSSKRLIEFYQTHTMVEKTSPIYRDLYTEIQKRHGKTNSLAISVLYTLGDLSLQLHDNKNAEFAYGEIHANLNQGADICHRDSIRACLALCTLYEKQRQYSSAQKLYAAVWHAFIKHGKEYELQAEFAEDLYQKYVRILKMEAKTDYAALHHLAIEYRKACVRFYGVASEITLKATLQLAEISEENDQHLEEAIAMYEEADQKSKDAPKGQISESTLAAIQAARKRLPHLYSISQLSTSPRAITLYSGEWDLQKKDPKKGYSHRDALIWLSLLAIAHAKQGNKESTLKANQAIETSVFEILRRETSSQKLADSGMKIAQIYLKSGLKSDAEALLSELRTQTVFGTSKLGKSLGLESGTKLDPLKWVFIITFSATLEGKKHILSSAMADLINEVFMYDEYHRSVAQKAPFVTTLVHGSRIWQFMKDIQDGAATTKVENELREYFASGLNAPKTSDKTVLAEFLNLVLLEIHTLEPDISVLKTSVPRVNAYFDAGKFQQAHDLSYLIDGFQQFQGGYNTLGKIDLGLQLAFVLAGRGKVKCQDPKISGAMLDLSSKITKQILNSIRATHVNVIEIHISQLSHICGLLGDHKNLDDLEWLLSALWGARDTQTSWTASTVVNIGRRLVETQFSHGHQDLAIQLCEDICYNLRRVWGALDATTLEMQNLLSSFYTAAGDYRKAMLVHEDVLRDTVGDKGDELPLPDASRIAVQHLELLKRAYQRLGGWDKEPQVYVDLYQQIAHVFGSEEGWKKSPPAPVDKWAPKGADSLGIWTQPESFEFISSGRKHANYLRKSSGSWNLLGNAHPHRLSRAYSSQSIAAA